MPKKLVDIVESICKYAGCSVAGLNCPNQVIISGSNETVDKAIELIKQAGKK